MTSLTACPLTAVCELMREAVSVSVASVCPQRLGTVATQELIVENETKHSPATPFPWESVLHKQFNQPVAAGFPKLPAGSKALKSPTWPPRFHLSRSLVGFRISKCLPFGEDLGA